MFWNAREKSRKKAIINCINYKQLQADPDSEPLKTIFATWCSQIILFQLNPEAPNIIHTSQAIHQQNGPRHRKDHEQLSCRLFFFFVFKVSTA